MKRALRLQDSPPGLIDAFQCLGADRSGAIALILGLGLPMLAGSASLAIDATGWMQAKTRVQGVADSAALSALAAVYAGETPSQAVAEAIAVAAAQGLKNGQNGVTVAVNNPPTSGSFAGSTSAFEVLITQQQETTFGKLFGVRPIVRGRSVAMKEGSTGTATCILSLDPTTKGGVTMSGGAIVNVQNCGTAANSSDKSAINLSGSGTTLTTDTFTVLGNYGVGAGVTLTAGKITKGVTTADPYEKVAVPTFSGCDYTDYSLNGGSATINPGVYCGSISVGSGGHLTMNPGVYILSGGNFKLTSSSLTAAGVSIVMTKDATGKFGNVQISGGAELTMSPPTSGPLQGVTIYMDRTAPTGTSNTIAGGANTAVSGSIYFPSQIVQYTGGTVNGPVCLQLIARIVKFAGGSKFDTDCGSLAVPGFGSLAVQKKLPVE